MAPPIAGPWSQLNLAGYFLFVARSYMYMLNQPLHSHLPMAVALVVASTASKAKKRACLFCTAVPPVTTSTTNALVFTAVIRLPQACFRNGTEIRAVTTAFTAPL